MRARNLKPSFFKDEELGELPPLTRLVYAGLSCLADFRGVLEDRPRRIKAELLPYDAGPPDIDEMLKQLAAKRKIVRFDSGAPYIWIPDFEREQNPHKQECAKGSSLPVPPRSEIRTSSEPVPNSTGTGSEVIGLIPDSRFLIADSGYRIPEDEAPNGDLLSEPEDSEDGEPGAKMLPPRVQWFEEFWAVVWEKIGRGAARKAWLSKVKTRSVADRVIAAARSQGPDLVASAKRNGHSVLHPATWLNQERYDDEPATAGRTLPTIAGMPPVMKTPEQMGWVKRPDSKV